MSDYPLYSKHQASYINSGLKGLPSIVSLLPSFSPVEIVTKNKEPGHFP